MNAQIPLPSFEDILKTLQFWVDQEDKWFYFEVGIIQIGSSGHTRTPPDFFGRPSSSHGTNDETLQYMQSRIVGKIKDVVFYPPSLLLQDVSVFTVSLSFGDMNVDIMAVEKREIYGLVFSQITYYEPIKVVDQFLKDDSRIKASSM